MHTITKISGFASQLELMRGVNGEYLEFNDTFISPGDVPNGSWSAKAMLKRDRKMTVPNARKEEET